MRIVAVPVLVLGLLATSALAGEITVADAYARSNNPRSAAAFMVLHNDGSAERLISVRSDIAHRVTLHRTVEEGGIMKMQPVTDGIDIPADGTLALKRGGLHVMLMGLATPLEQGDSFALTLVFGGGQEVTVEIPVDNAHKP